jgi:hypothetical protein
MSTSFSPPPSPLPCAPIPVGQGGGGLPQYAPGQRVRNRYGDELTVCLQRGLQVWVYEEPNRWYHPLNLSATGACAKGSTPQTAGRVDALLLSGVGSTSSLPLVPVAGPYPAAGARGAS